MALSRILGPDGKPLELDTLGEEIATPRMTGVRQVWHEAVADNLTPSRLARILRGAAHGDADDYLTLAEDMEERDLHYASVLGTRKLALSGLTVRVDSLSDDKADVRIADAVRAFVDAPEFGEMLMHQTDALGKGYAVSEIVWDRSGREWQPTYRDRDPRWFVYDRDDGRTLRLRDEANMVNGVPLPLYKFIVHEPRIRSGLPIRGGLARLAAVGYMCKAWSWKDWMAFADIFGLPMRIGKYGPNASDKDISALMSAVANLGSDAAAVMPQSMQIELTQAASTAGAGDFFEKLASWWDRQISKGVLGQTMTADDGASLSQARVHDGVRLDLLGADAKSQSNTLNRSLVRPFVDLNFGPGRYPKLVVVVPEPEDTKLLVDALGVLVPLGLEVEQSVMRDKLGLPDPAKGAVLLRPAAMATPADTSALNVEHRRSSRALNAEADPVRADYVDALTDILVERAAPATAEWLARIRTEVREAKDFDELLGRLSVLLTDLPLDDLAQIITGAVSVADRAARADIEDEARA